MVLRQSLGQAAFIDASCSGSCPRGVGETRVVLKAVGVIELTLPWVLGTVGRSDVSFHSVPSPASASAAAGPARRNEKPKPGRKAALGHLFTGSPHLIHPFYIPYDILAMSHPISPLDHPLAGNL
jgi:hypothetical protein